MSDSTKTERATGPADPDPVHDDPRAPVPFLARAPIRLLLTSAAILFVELLLIRWIPSEVRYVGFFSNFLLMASFLGIGLGILLGRRSARWSTAIFPVLLVAVVAIVAWNELDVEIASSDELFFGLKETAADTRYDVLLLVVVLVTAVLAALALPLGRLLRSMPPLKAYGIDIVGSLLGIAGFTVLSAAGTPPIVWFSVVAVLLALLVLGARVRLPVLAGAAGMAGVIAIVAFTATPTDTWSPYYRIGYNVDILGRQNLKVNGIPHQTLHPVDSLKEPFYQQVYAWFPDRRFEEILIVGAGSGSDVAMALANADPEHIDAVEIDPVLQQIGVDRHPDRPYQDPRVSRHVNDGRAFLRGTEKKYDLIVFALPDSLTLVSSAASIRLESFLFTEGAFAAVRDHLSDDGVFVLYNYYREDWLIAKLAGMLETVFGHQPLVRDHGFRMATFAAGPAVAALPDGVPIGGRVDPVPAIADPQPVTATDDWPFLYLRTPFIAPYYLVALAAILLGALVAVLAAARVSGTPIRRFSPHFFVLGIAFLLLETRSLVSFSLLFGTTWLVNALAFFAILVSVLLSIFVNARFPIRRPQVLYVALFATLALAWLLPPESLLLDPPWLRYLLAAALAFAPVFCANLVFTQSFRDTKTADMAFASNLLGAMVGGALEYLALITGYQALLVVVAILYGAAWLFASRVRMLADRELGPGGEAAAG
ncbi:MAG: spermidine synthase [Chloroflexota bacterium]